MAPRSGLGTTIAYGAPPTNLGDATTYTLLSSVNHITPPDGPRVKDIVIKPALAGAGHYEHVPGADDTPPWKFELPYDAATLVVLEGIRRIRKQWLVSYADGDADVFFGQLVSAAIQQLDGDTEAKIICSISKADNTVVFGGVNPDNPAIFMTPSLLQSTAVFSTAQSFSNALTAEIDLPYATESADDVPVPGGLVGDGISPTTPIGFDGYGNPVWNPDQTTWSDPAPPPLWGWAAAQPDFDFTADMFGGTLPQRIIGLLINLDPTTGLTVYAGSNYCCVKFNDGSWSAPFDVASAPLALAAPPGRSIVGLAFLSFDDTWASGPQTQNLIITAVGLAAS